MVDNSEEQLVDKWYIMDQEGRMVTESVTLMPDQKGLLEYLGLVG